MEKLVPLSDRWIMGILNYMGINHDFYHGEMAGLVEYVHERNLDVKWKKELKPHLKTQA